MTTLLLWIGGTPDGGAPNPFVQMVPFFLILAIFYFVLIRPQQKRVQDHQKFVNSLKKGDDVITESGLYGTVVAVNDDSVVLKVADNVRVKFLKAKVTARQSALAESKSKK